MNKYITSTITVAVLGILTYTFAQKDKSEIVIANDELINENIETKQSNVPSVDPELESQIKTQIMLAEMDYALEEEGFVIEEAEIARSAFEETEVTKVFNEFYQEFDSAKSLTEEEIQLFFSRMRATLDSSPHAREQIAQIYGAIPSDQHVHRGIMQEMLSGSIPGRQIMVEEARQSLENNDTTLAENHFQVLANFTGEVDYDVLDKALDAIKSDDEVVGALNYIGLLERDENASIMFSTVVTSKLKDASQQAAHPMTRAMALQKLYRLTSPEESAEIAYQHLTTDPTEMSVTETLYAINDSQVVVNDYVWFSLREALTREGVTENEVELAKELFPGLLEQQS